MKYGNFEYRVVSNGPTGYYVLQVFEKDGVYYFISKQPASPYATSFEQLKSNLKGFNDALEKPILLFSDIREMSSMPL